MTARPRTRRARPCPWAAAVLVLAACSHENPPVPPPPARDAIDVSAAALETREDGAPATFEVVLRSRPSAPVDVEVRSGDPNEGLVLAPGHAAPAEACEISFTPADWDVPRRVTVHPVEDHVVDGSVAYAVALRVAFSDDPAYARVPPAAVRVTNADADVRGIVVSAVALTTSESGTTADLGVWLASSASLGVAVEISDPSEGCIVPPWGGCDGQMNLWFDPSSSSQPQRVTVRGLDDALADGPRTYQLTFRVAFLPPGDPWLSAPVRRVDVTNLDDEVAAVSVLPASVPLVTFERGTRARFEVALNAAPLEEVRIPIASGDWTEGLVSVAGQPAAATATLTFTPASYAVPQTVEVVGVDDAVPRDDVAYAVSVGPATGLDPVYPTLPAQAVEVVNVDDEDAGLWIPEAATTLWTDEWRAAASFTIVLRKPPVAELAVPVSVGDPAEGLVALGVSTWDPQPLVTVTFTPLDWDVPRTITVVGQPDDVIDGPRTYAISVGPGIGDPEYAAAPPAYVTVTNADASVAGWSGTAGWTWGPYTVEGGGPSWFALRLSTRPFAPVAVPVTSGDPSEGLLATDPAGSFEPSLVLTFTAEDWDVDHRVWFHGPADGEVDGDRWYQITMGPMSSADPSYDGLPVWWVIGVRNRDADVAP